ncbi:unnamed protein product [Prorocentrum cordatum]|uniref:Uncharacterized protein n=1 Tax=Prorocentrum cordatum TaxID=2364126 RepID=A0ABN9SLT2_9DINO|nr:unnamed protein product [Polarella glacialis]
MPETILRNSVGIWRKLERCLEHARRHTKVASSIATASCSSSMRSGTWVLRHGNRVPACASALPCVSIYISISWESQCYWAWRPFLSATLSGVHMFAVGTSTWRHVKMPLEIGSNLVPFLEASRRWHAEHPALSQRGA